MTSSQAFFSQDLIPVDKAADWAKELHVSSPGDDKYSPVELTFLKPWQAVPCFFA